MPTDLDRIASGRIEINYLPFAQTMVRLIQSYSQALSHLGDDNPVMLRAGVLLVNDSITDLAALFFGALAEVSMRNPAIWEVLKAAVPTLGESEEFLRTQLRRSQEISARDASL